MQACKFTHYALCNMNGFGLCSLCLVYTCNSIKNRDEKSMFQSTQCTLAIVKIWSGCIYDGENYVKEDEQ